MPLWGKTATSADNKPKFLPDDTNSDYDMHDAYATNSGWVMKAGSKATGNGNASATPEVLCAIRGLAGATDTTGLKLPTMTKFRITKNNPHDEAPNNIEFEISFDEQVEVKSGGTAATIVLDALSGTSDDETATLISLDGTAFAAGVKGSTLLFRASSNAATTYRILDNTDIGDPDLKDAISGGDLDQAGTRFTSATKTAIDYEDIVIAAT
tara:strand:+ start:130 stop:762 length:633 start_codon:yes stop_codon:yes gene_type:complete